MLAAFIQHQIVKFTKWYFEFSICVQRFAESREDNMRASSLRSQRCSLGCGRCELVCNHYFSTDNQFVVGVVNVRRVHLTESGVILFRMLDNELGKMSQGREGGQRHRIS